MADDLISRLAAIDALEKEKPTPFVNIDGSIEPFGAGRQNQWYRDGIAIMNLPSAQSEPKWIPCEERLPEEDTEVLVTGENGEIDIAEWKYDSWTEDDVVVWEGSGYSYIDPVAWMPLPKPWKGE